MKNNKLWLCMQGMRFTSAMDLFACAHSMSRGSWWGPSRSLMASPWMWGPFIAPYTFSLILFSMTPWVAHRHREGSKDDNKYNSIHTKQEDSWMNPVVGPLFVQSSPRILCAKYLCSEPTLKRLDFFIRILVSNGADGSMFVWVTYTSTTRFR